MSAETVALEAAYQAEINELTDAIGKAEADVILKRYIAALDAQQKVAAGSLQSYTIAGRTITRRNAGEGEAQIENLRAQLAAYVRSPVSYVDMGGWA